MFEVQTVSSEADAPKTNNVVRHEYRVLTDAEKAQMQSIKDAGRSFLELLDARPASRELSIARTKIEEAVMWAVKDITR